MAIKYRFRRADLGQDWTEDAGFVVTAARVWKASKKLRPGPFSIRRWDDDDSGDWGRDRPRREAVRRFLGFVKNSKEGDYWSLKGDGDKRLIVRTIETQARVVNTAGNPRIDRIYSEVVAKFDHVGSAGICACRPIAGSSTWSQHAYCNAWDIVASFNEMGKISAWLVANHGRLDIHTVIFNHRIWSAASGWHAYTGVDPHTGHVHVDCDPWGNGTPPCAR